MSSTQLPVVLVTGATGYTGSAIVKHLISTNSFTVIVLIRPTSVSKPLVKEFEAGGAQIRLGDIVDPLEKLEEVLQDVDILISTAMVFDLESLKLLFLAASKVGVKRVIPSDFGPHAPRGATVMNDIKLDVRDYIKSINLPYTFIEVGCWVTGIFPFPHDLPNTWNAPKHFVGTGDVRSLYSTLESIPPFVERIIIDERTLNKAVLIHDGEYTLNETRRLGEKISGEDFADYPTLSDKELKERMQSNEIFVKITSASEHSMYVKGENSLARVKEDGVLVARELYEGIPVADLEPEGRKFYAKPFIWGQTDR
ncbi:NAD(P)-binding protein [Cylindrobasidium torrendii FP15055 ss-10]|uniref:NAD(P)-binding protein n=1 Tax=Cylindrobasidium torrendii FP15055 ss-10 TaxID=1314674 RepID=A0A0D7BUD4_9AGAR|nr:NAD(P)-binding protein [Cylindrobasidium torrendii FP15055 ss-10]